MVKYEYLKQLNMHHYDKDKHKKQKGLENNLLHERCSTWEDVLGFKETLFSYLWNLKTPASIEN